jgi:Zn-dependent protease
MWELAPFRLFGIPLRVRPSFLVIALLLGWTSGFGSMAGFVTWVVVVFVSIVVHELGHALVARSFGAVVEIELNGFGGLTRWAARDQGELSPGRRAAVAAAGSAVGLLFGGLVWVLSQTLGPFAGIPGLATRLLIYVNVFWGLLNWLPIRPLDGGHLLTSLLEKVVPQRATQVARVIFIITTAAALVVAVQYQLIFVAILSGWLLLGELGLGTARQSAPATMPELSYDDPAEQEAGPGLEPETEDRRE